MINGSFARADPGLDLVTSVAAGRMLLLVLRHLIRISLVGAAELSAQHPAAAGYITPATTCNHSENQNLSKGVLLVPTTDTGI